MVEITLVSAPAILAHGDALSGHKYCLAVLTQRLDFCGLPLLLEVAFFLLCTADNFTLMAAALKLSGLLC